MTQRRSLYTIACSLALLAAQASAQTTPQLLVENVNTWDLSDEQLVWHDGENVYLKSLLTGQRLLVAEDDAPCEVGVSGNTVVWTSASSGICDVYGFDIPTRTTWLIDDFPESKYDLQIAGNTVLWVRMAQAGLDTEIVIHDLLTQQDTVLATGSILVFGPATDGEHVAWWNQFGNHTQVYSIADGDSYTLDVDGLACGLEHSVLASVSAIGGSQQIQYADLKTGEIVTVNSGLSAADCSLAGSSLIYGHADETALIRHDLPTGVDEQLVDLANHPGGFVPIGSIDNHVLWRQAGDLYGVDLFDDVQLGTAVIGHASGLCAPTLKLRTLNVPQAGQQLHIQVTGAAPNAMGFLYAATKPDLLGSSIFRASIFLDQTQLLHIRIPMFSDENGTATMTFNVPIGSEYSKYYLQSEWACPKNAVGITNALKINVLPNL